MIDWMDNRFKNSVGGRSFIKRICCNQFANDLLSEQKKYPYMCSIRSSDVTVVLQLLPSHPLSLRPQFHSATCRPIILIYFSRI